MLEHVLIAKVRQPSAEGCEMSAELHGRYRILNDAALRKKAENTDDPRCVFYVAMLASQTYAEYLSKVGSVEVQPETYKTKPVSGRMEIVYCRDQRHWIADA
jgi:hypothetical protein